MLTNEIILAESGQYDKEIIQRIRVNNRGNHTYNKIFLRCTSIFFVIIYFLGIEKIANLDYCLNLLELNLAHNSVSSLR